MRFGGDYCAWCGEFHDPSDLRKVERWEESARSGGSTTYRGSLSGMTWGTKKGRKSTGGISYNTGRTYYKKVKELVCVDCLRAEQAREKREAEEAARNTLVIIGVFAFMALFVFIFG